MIKYKVYPALCGLFALMAVAACDDNPTVEDINLTFTVSGNGGIESITDEDGNIKCGKDASGTAFAEQDCSIDVDKGESVTLTATPSAGSTFSQWSASLNGAEFTCTTSNICTVTLNNDTVAQATFAP